MHERVRRSANNVLDSKKPAVRHHDGSPAYFLSLPIIFIQIRTAGAHLLIEDVLKAPAFFIIDFPLLGDRWMWSEVLLIECHNVMYR
ncbi:hypothetical protein VK70_08295 [Paenibacillus durus ATCC 35681]|uniref:Uncharacterized protein n=1 Tax=Paenibacillus durus ATCC 35681 TaxID=1333534 RepID=A0A0F7F9D7_PAEDU|nr:hypothetical protein VK70_08295 [Paenibacillus durus ATCC 35681]